VAILAVRPNGVIVAVFMTTCTRLCQATVRLSATFCDLFQNPQIDDVLFCMAGAAFSRGVFSGANEARQVVVKRFLVNRRKKIVPPLMLPVAGDALLCRDLEMIPPPLSEGNLNLLMADKALLTCNLVCSVVALQAVIHSGEMLVGERQFPWGKLGRRDVARASPDKRCGHNALESHGVENLEPRVTMTSCSTVSMSN
jgi:hypothetical protein